MLYYLSSVWTLASGIRNWPHVVLLFLGLWRDESLIIELRASGVRFRVRSPMDVWIVKETWLDRHYERFGAAIRDGWVVIDVGAGLGDFSVFAATGRPRTRVYAYEPFPESFALLGENVRLNRLVNVELFPLAVSAHGGEVVLGLAGEAVQHSTARPRPADMRRLLRVASVTLEGVFEQGQIGWCDFLKMDCEGAEYEILFNTPDDCLRRIGLICLEYHDGVIAYSHRDLIHFFAQRGFRVLHHPSPVWTHLGFLQVFNPCRLKMAR